MIKSYYIEIDKVFIKDNYIFRYNRNNYQNTVVYS